MNPPSTDSFCSDGYWEKRTKGDTSDYWGVRSCIHGNYLRLQGSKDVAKDILLTIRYPVLNQWR